MLLDLDMNLLVTFMLPLLLTRIITFHVVSTSADTLSHNQTLPSQPKDTFSSGTQNDTYCDYHGVCGPNGNCDLSKSPPCLCLSGFTPKSPSGFDTQDYSQGCVRKAALNCSTDVFFRYSVFREPSGIFSIVNQSLGEKGCKANCLRNCSCMAYSTGSLSVCKLWSGVLFDVRVITEGGTDLYVRMPASEQESGGVHSRHTDQKRVGVIVGCSIATISVIMIVAFCYMLRRRTTSKAMGNIRARAMPSYISEQNGDMELPLLELSRIEVATDNFSANNKLGQGGFGLVYKGLLDDGQQIAVKRLSRSSEQGLQEFKNEVILIAKLQHRNLVKLLGCCIQDEEKLLIYEYMPNRSLDYFIFDQTQQKLLDWPKRFNIICGIARGLLYLHEDSRLRIIHRDLKASNILLDSEMEPRISDFGLAKIFGGDQNKGNTKRVVGTYGYMAPEYAVSGQFSVKSDVFSFGILLLEIITGRKVRGFYYPNDNDNIYGLAWDLWKQGRALELVDECINESWNLYEVERCIHISLMCSQQHPRDRPSMSYVVLMLGSEVRLPQPKFPAFFNGEPSRDTNYSSAQNELSITELLAR